MTLWGIPIPFNVYTTLNDAQNSLENCLHNINATLHTYKFLFFEMKNES